MKLQDLCAKIGTFLSEHPDYIAFKIGKTKDIEARKEDPDYKAEGYQFIWHLLSGQPEDVSYAENYLEKYFMNYSLYNGRCQNNRIGGGSDEADKVYIVLKKMNFTITAVYNDETLIDKSLPANIDR